MLFEVLEVARTEVVVCPLKSLVGKGGAEGEDE